MQTHQVNPSSFAEKTRTAQQLHSFRKTEHMYHVKGEKLTDENYITFPHIAYAYAGGSIYVCVLERLKVEG